MVDLEKIRIAEFVSIKKFFLTGRNVLEIGGGNGYQANLIASLGVKVESIDINPFTGMNKEFDVKQYDGRILPFEDSSFDVVFSSNVLEHIKDLEFSLGEIHRVLRPNGLAVHILPTSSWRLWTSLTHYQYCISRLLGLQSTIGNGHTPSIKEKIERSGLLSAISRAVVAGPHGEYPSAVSELWYFSRIRWARIFNSNHFVYHEKYPGRIFYSGYLVAPWIPIKYRRMLSYFLGSSTYVHVLNKK
jgi:SAM-dependent methyltransferase